METIKSNFDLPQFIDFWLSVVGEINDYVCLCITLQALNFIILYLQAYNL